MTSTTTMAETLAAFAVETTSFPAEAIGEGKRLILDQLTSQIACAPLPTSQKILNAMSSLGGSEVASVIYDGRKLPLDMATFVNSAFGHGGEYDDTQLKSNNHAGAVVVPPALALAEQTGASGRDFLEAVVVGAEILIRVGNAAAPYLFNRNHHVPQAVGPFGSAAACSRLLSLAAEKATYALAIAGSFSAGHLEYTQTGGSIKRVHCAVPAVAGLQSVTMAIHGITGPKTVLEGKKGFLKTFAGEFDLAALTSELGRRYDLLETAYKPITAPYGAHGALGALDELVRSNSLSPEQIKSIDIATGEFSIKNAGAIVKPAGVLEAHFSLAWGCAVRMYRGGNGFYDYRAEDLEDSRFVKMAQRVRLTVDPKCDEDRLRLNARPATVTITTTDGRRFEKYVLYPKGHWENPMTNEDLEHKFLDAVVPLIGSDRAKRIIETVWDIDRQQGVSELISLTLKQNATAA